MPRIYGKHSQAGQTTALLILRTHQNHFSWAWDIGYHAVKLPSNMPLRMHYSAKITYSVTRTPLWRVIFVSTTPWLGGLLGMLLAWASV